MVLNNSFLVKLLDLIDSGYWKSKDWKIWADQLTEKIDQPPSWVMQLGLANDSTAAVSILRNSMSECAYSDLDNHKTIVLGYLYLRFREGDLDLLNFLTTAWQETESGGDTASISNSRVFELYDRFKASKGTAESLSMLVGEVEKEFLQASNLARLQLTEVTNWQWQ